MQNIFVVLILLLHILVTQIIQDKIGFHYRVYMYPDVTDRPIVGIFTQPTDYPEFPQEIYTYLAASYVKFIESAGARVIPIPFDSDKLTLEFIFQQINGILIPGGLSEINGPTPLALSIQYMVQRAIRANDEGDFFPIMGICLGHQAMHYILSDFETIKKFLSKVQNQSAKSTYLNVTNRQGVIFNNVNDELYSSITQDKIVYFNHYWGVSPSLYERVPKLKQFFQITSINTDDNGTDFVAVAQGIKYPFISVQYHPEKNNYEFKIPANHSKNAVIFTQIHGDEFISLVRKNSHKFLNKNLEREILIYQFNPSQIQSATFTQIYVFKLGALEQIYKKYIPDL